MKEKSFSKKLYHTSREIARGSFRRFTGGSPAFLSVWGGQPVFEVGVVGADEDGGVFLVKIDFGGLFLLGRSCSHRLILSAALSRNRGVFRGFSSALDLGKMAIFKQERAAPPTDRILITIKFR